jgi:hypothetical protein
LQRAEHQKLFFIPIMQNKPIKYLLYAFVAFVLLFAALVGYLLANKNQIKKYAIEQLNSQLNAQISINNIDITLFKQFPKVSLDMHLVRITDPTQPKQYLLQAEHVYIGFNIYDIIKKQYNIKLIALDSAQINLYTDLAGKSNYNIFKEDTSSQNNQGFLLSLKEVQLNQVNVVYINRANKQHHDVRLQEVLLSGDFSSNAEKINCKGLVFSRKIKSDKFQLAKNKLITLDVEMAINNQTETFTFKKGFIDLDMLQLNLEGSITNKKHASVFDIKVSARKLDIPSMLSLLPSGVSLPSDLQSDGELHFNGVIQGEASQSKSPKIAFTFGVKNGKLQKGDGLSLSNISFAGEFSNGPKQNAQQSFVKLNDLKFTLNKGNVMGNLTITDFTNPKLTTNLKGSLNASDLVAFIKSNQIKQAQGNIKFDINFNGLLANASTINWLQNKANGSVDVNLTNLVFGEKGNTVDVFNALFTVNGKDVDINKLETKINQSDVKITGTLKNLIPYLLIKNEKLNAQISYQSNQLDINNFAAFSSPSKDTLQAGFALPDNITIEANVSANKLMYNLFTAQDVKARLFWREKIIAVEDFSAQTMEGSIQLDGQIENAPDGRFLITASSNLKGISITRLFKECNDFGQKEITQKHLKGKLSGEINFVGVWGNNFTCDLNKLYVLSKIKISNGELVNYEPLNALGKYIDVNELRNLKFADLDNTIEIKNKTIFIPQFDVKNNALNMTLSGSHTFANVVDYKMKIKLGELLKNKRKKSSNEFNEEEPTADRGVNLYMNMKGPIDNVTISYDKVGTKQKITQELQQEKQNIKEILKKELGIDNKSKSNIKEKQKDDDELEFEAE